MNKKIFSSILLCILALSIANLIANQNNKEWDPTEHKGILYDYHTGEPKAIIIVGEHAAKSDYEAAYKLAEKVLEKYFEALNPSEAEKEGMIKMIVQEDSSDLVTYGLKTRKNLILIGGPGPVIYYDEKESTYKEKEHCNILTNQLIIGKQEDNRDTFGRSMINWYKSLGEYEYIRGGFVGGKDVIIIAGKDREATARAVDKFIEDTWKEN